jgi:DNA-binding IclR family transcriptional regulator
MRKNGNTAPASAADGPGVGTKSLENAIAVLLAFVDAPHSLGVTEIARIVGMHKSTVSRQLAALARVDFVKRDEGGLRYTLGLGLLPLAAVALAKHRLNADARRQLEMLARETGETVTFSGWNGKDAVNIDQISGDSSIQHVAPPGRLNPAHCTATGKVFLASLAAQELEQRLAAPLKRYTRSTIVDRGALMAEIDAVRSRGYATSDYEFLDDVCSIAAPVRSGDGVTRYAIAVTVPAYRRDRHDLDAIKEPLLFTARNLSLDF